MLGLDWSARPADEAMAQELADAGVVLVMRYVSYPYHHADGTEYPNPKDLTADEARILTSKGIRVGTVFEQTAGRAKLGADVGEQDGRAAKAKAEACGAPSWAPIIAAVDFGADDEDLPIVAAYLDGFARGCAPHPRGPYGSYKTVTTMLRDGHGSVAWQTLAWSWDSANKRWLIADDPRVPLLQKIEQRTFGGVDCDVNDVRDPAAIGWFVNEEDDVDPVTKQKIDEIHDALFAGAPNIGVPSIQQAVVHTAYRVVGYEPGGEPGARSALGKLYDTLGASDAVAKVADLLQRLAAHLGLTG